MFSQMVKLTLIASLSIGVAFAADANKKKGSILKNEGVTINYINENEESKTTVIKRITDPACKKVNGMNPSVIWGGDYAQADVPANCKKTFVTTVGKISPIKMKGIETYGELEVIDYMKRAQTDKNLLLVDARMADWYAQRTIPTSINIPFKSFNPKLADFEIVMDAANVVYDEGVYDFSNAKTLLLYCNGIWCPQSTWAIENLLKIGYPKEKLIWYRGGMYSWTSVNLTTVVPMQ